MTSATGSDEWLTIDDLSKLSGRSVKSIKRLRDRKKIPDCYLKISRNKYVHQLYHIHLVTFLEERKSFGLKLCEKITEDINQPADAIFVPDPDGVYCGFWLTEDQAILLAEIRIKKRMEGDSQFESQSRIGIFQAEVGARIAKKW